MFPDSPYAVPVGSFRTPVALVDVDPQAPPLVYIGVNCAWIPMIAGALTQLLLQSTWATSDPAALNLVQQRVFDLISLFNCATAPTIDHFKLGTSGPSEELMIRQNPTNPCLLESSIDGVEWCPFADLSKCFGAPPQPGAGTPQPTPGGGCRQYHGQLNANGKWILPAPVNTGDTIEFLNGDGATNDGADLEWYCPDGSQFFAGGCIENGHTDGSDPLPSANHMSVIALIDSTYYSLTGGILTVPSGHTNAQVILQVNDDDLGDNSGQIAFDIQLCNNLPGSFTHVFDFTTSPGPFRLETTSDPDHDNPHGVWTAGLGWTTTDALAAGPSGDYYRRCAIITTTSFSRTITNATLYYDYTAGPTNDSSTPGVEVYPDLVITQAAAPSGTGLQAIDIPTTDPLTYLVLSVLPSRATSAGGLGGSAVIKKLIVTGVGSDPF